MKPKTSEVVTDYSHLSKSAHEKHIAKPYRLKRYYTAADVAVHNTANDNWVSFFHDVFDLTKLIQDNHDSPLIDPLVQNAGKDISWWFDPVNREPKTCIDPKSGLKAYYLPMGRYLHIPSTDPTQDSQDNQQDFDIPWWKDKKQYCIGKLTVKSRKIKIVNMLTAHEDILEVPCEETINEILERYKEINAHASSYTWKRLGEPLQMESTLAENGIPDETEEFERLEIDQESWYVPAIHLYFNDDLTIA